MKQGWEIKKLGDLCNLMTGGTPSRSKMEYFENGTIKWLVSGDIHKKEIFDCEGRITELGMANSNAKLLPVNSVMIALNGQGKTRGTVALLRTDATCNQSLVSIYPKDIRKVLPEFIFCNLHGRYEEIRKITGDDDNDRRGLNMPLIRNIEIPLPPLPEQQRIVSILDECFAAIDKAKTNAEQNLKNTKELFESYLQEVFEIGNWETKTLKDVAKVFGRGKSKHRPRNWEGLYGGKYPFIQTGEVRNANKYVSNYHQTYNEVGLAQSKLWKKGTICITIAANIAETAILDFDACIPDSIIGFEVDDKKADLNFAYYLLQYFKAELQKLGKGSAQDNINLGTFENQYFPFPPLKEQQTIVRQLDALRAKMQKLEAVYQKKIADLEELKKSILQKAFAGELKIELIEAE